jgi:hypothetical protein
MLMYADRLQRGGICKGPSERSPRRVNEALSLAFGVARGIEQPGASRKHAPLASLRRYRPPKAWEDRHYSNNAWMEGVEGGRIKSI